MIDSAWPFVEKRFLESALRISASTLKPLRMTPHPGEHQRERPPLYQNHILTQCSSRFPQLRELELMADFSSSSHEVLLSSITSTELRKVIFLVWNEGDWLFEQGMKAWILIDRQLCRLVDRLRPAGYRFTLEAELRLSDYDPRRHDVTVFA